MEFEQSAARAAPDSELHSSALKHFSHLHTGLLAASRHKTADAAPAADRESRFHPLGEHEVDAASHPPADSRGALHRHSRTRTNARRKHADRVVHISAPYSCSIVSFCR